MINPNTIMRAYRELESEGYLYNVQGKGCFAGSLEQVESSRKMELRKIFTDSARELLGLGVSFEELCDILKQEEL